MLPNINLDDEYFSDIFEEAKKMIHSTFPEWTDYNEHDPGIMFLELFSWMKEMQQYHLNHIGDNSLLKYLDLLDIAIMRRNPAHAAVEVSGIRHPLKLLKGSVVKAADIVFETTVTSEIEDVKIVKLLADSSGFHEEVDQHIINSGKLYRIEMFGEDAENNSTFSVNLSQALKTDKTYCFYFKIEDKYPVKRNPIEDSSFIPFADLTLEYFSGGIWKEAELVTDETYCFIQSGKLAFKIFENMTPSDQGYQIRFRIDKSAYDVPPVLLKLSTNVIPLKQQTTFADAVQMSYSSTEELTVDHYLFEAGKREIFSLKDDKYRLVELEDGRLRTDLDGETILVSFYQEDFSKKRLHEMNGFPGQVIELEDSEILYEDFEILIEDEVEKGAYYKWKKVNSFAASTPEDRHYILNDDRGEVQFGNGEKSRCPEGTLIIIGYVSSRGEKGNAKIGQITELIGYETDLKLINNENAHGGRNKESIEEAFKRFRRTFKVQNRAVTLKDYEHIVRHAPGLRIKNVQAVTDREDDNELTVLLVVEPYAFKERSSLSGPYMKNLDQLLLKKRLVGMNVRVISPEFIGASFYGEIVVKPHYIKAQSIVDHAIRTYFEDVSSHYGKNITISELYGIIDGLDCVQYVENISINTKGRKVTRNQKGDIQLPVNGLLYLEEADYYITST